jgi:acetyl-CoA C-acetyltransferase
LARSPSNVRIAGAFEHPQRVIPDKSLAQVHAECALGALADAGLTTADVDGIFCSGDAPGYGSLSLFEYLDLKVRHTDNTDAGGAAPIVHVGHAVQAIRAGKCDVALITLAGLPRQAVAGGLGMEGPTTAPESGFEDPFGVMVPAMYALAAQRHMYEYGTTSAQLAEIRVAAAHHAQYNPNAYFQKPVTVEEVLASRMIADPLHLLDCCVITDGGGALVVVSPEVAQDLSRRSVEVLGFGEASRSTDNGRVDLTTTGAARSGPIAFAEAGVSTKDIDYASIYDSFTITVLETIEDLGFCAKGEGGNFVRDGALMAPFGALPFNTDGGGLCNNHPGNRGGMTKVIEAVRQLRGEANAPVQVPDCEIALAHGTGGYLATRMVSATVVLGRGD